MTLPVSDHVHAVTWGYAGDTGGMYVICIWGVTQMGVRISTAMEGFSLLDMINYVAHTLLYRFIRLRI